MKQHINYVGINFGADPELFLKKGDKIIGSEKIIPEGGVAITGPLQFVEGKLQDSRIPLVIRDGVQVEFNVQPNSCRQVFSTNLRDCFVKLTEQITTEEQKSKSISYKLMGRYGRTKTKEKVVPCFDQTVAITPEEMTSLSIKSQQFGCTPSHNAYGDASQIIEDASQYFSRSAGGHLHLGLSVTLGDMDKAVKILDVLLGNTCVLLDRHTGNVERRKMYGRAGEYRLPRHGLEYRVLSNFWLRSYQLMSFVTGMARFAISVANDSKAANGLLNLVELNKVQYAINNNDFGLAMENFLDIKDYVANIGLSGTQEAIFPLEDERADFFLHFVEKGLDHWFKDDILKHWLDHVYSQRNGWERFIDQDVATDMANADLKELVMA